MRRGLTFLTALSLLAVPIVDGPVASAGFPGRNGAIAFGRTSNGQDDLWILPRGAARPRRLTNTPGRSEAMPDYRADGARIAFARCGPGELANCDIWTIRADGTDPRRLTFTPDVQETWPAWSPNGSRIAYTSDAADAFQDVWVMDADGSGQRRVTTTVGFDAFPEWSPNGTRIAFTSDRAALDDIWTIRPNGTGARRLTTGMRIDERPDWSPDGSTITFSRNGNIWSMDADGDHEVQLTFDPAGEFGSAFSPNGRRIAFVRRSADGRFGVWTMRADGTDAVRRTFGVFDVFPDWRPI